MHTTCHTHVYLAAHFHFTYILPQVHSVPRVLLTAVSSRSINRGLWSALHKNLACHTRPWTQRQDAFGAVRGSGTHCILTWVSSCCHVTGAPMQHRVWSAGTKLSWSAYIYIHVRKRTHFRKVAGDWLGHQRQH